MHILEIIVLGCSLAVDATAISITNGLVYQKLTKKRVLLSSLVFGLFQGIMPLLGYYLTSLTSLNSSVKEYVEKIDHWVAFGLLALLGGKMILDGIQEIRRKKKKMEEESSQDENLPIGRIFIQGIATSIDAFAVGISLYANQSASETTSLSIWWIVSIIAVITFSLSFAGSFFGHKLGRIFKKVAPFIGGVVLILIGTSILLEHMGVLSF